jgi:hypothetical protein
MKNDYEVGYGKPPKATRFVKGKSGNPYGRPPSCSPKATPDSFVDILMKELDAPIAIMEGGRPKKMSKQRALIKSLVKCAIDGSSGAITRLFKLVREHGLNLNDLYAINILKERRAFVLERFDVSRMSESEIEEAARTVEEFLKHPVSYLTGKLRLPPNHSLNLKPPRLKRRPSTTIADDLLCELRERITIREGTRKFTITKLEALVKSLLNQAILGNSKAFSLLLIFYKQYGWDKEDASVVKLSAFSPLGRFIGLGGRRRVGSRRSGRSKRLLDRSSRDGKGGDDVRQSADY